MPPERWWTSLLDAQNASMSFTGWSSCLATVSQRQRSNAIPTVFPAIDSGEEEDGACGAP
eukprot:7629940-Pyramimonas_sp.AAC.1